MKAIVFLFPTLLFSFLVSIAQNSLTIVENRKAKSVIVIDEKARRHIKEAARDLQLHIKLSTGADVPIINAGKVKRLENDKVKLVVGYSTLTRRKFKKDDLEKEQYLLKTDVKANTIYFLANDWNECPATHYAVSDFLERVMDAKWLWPGALGTTLEKKPTLSVPEMDIKWKTPYDVRLFKRVATHDVRKWFIHQRIARRREYQELSNNQDWHAKYYSKYPEMFARTPDGRPYNGSWEMKNPKFRLDNQTFFDLMVNNFKEKGSPSIYFLHPCDGTRYDAFMVPGADPLEVYRGQVPVTRYYLDFFHRFDAFINKDRTEPIRFDINGYGANYFFPDDFTFDGRNFNVWFVDKGADSVNWLKWRASGARMYLRPNWWKNAPYGPEVSIKTNGGMFNFCRDNGMFGFKIDGFQEDWVFEGLNYYVLARQGYTDKTVEELAEEYYSGFGNAISEVREYFTEVEENTEKFKKKSNEELLVQTVEEDDLNDCSIGGSVESLHPPEYIDKLRYLLEIGARKAAGEDRERVEWLMSGLKVTEYVNNYKKKAMEQLGSLPNPEELSSFLSSIERQYPHSISVSRLEAVLMQKPAMLNRVYVSKVPAAPIFGRMSYDKKVKDRYLQALQTAVGVASEIDKEKIE